MRRQGLLEAVAFLGLLLPLGLSGCERQTPSRVHTVGGAQSLGRRHGVGSAMGAQTRPSPLAAVTQRIPVGQGCCSLHVGRQ